MRVLISAIVALAVVGCGVSKDEFLAKQLEAEKYRKSYADETQKSADLQKKVDELTSRVGSLEEKLKASEADAAAKQATVDELTKSKAQLALAKHELEQKSSEYEQLAKSLKNEIAAGQIELSELKGKMTVKLKDKILFSSGSDRINKEGKEALKKVAEAFRSVKGKIVRVEGHTDNVPIATQRFPTNWELSSARAIAVVRYLQDQGVDPRLLAAAGYSEYQPVASNEAADGRSLNRRIEIVLAAGEPAPAPSPSPAAAPAGSSM